MPQFLKEREVFMAFVGLITGLILLVIGLIAGDNELRTYGFGLIGIAITTIGLSRGLAKMGTSNGKTNRPTNQ